MSKIFALLLILLSYSSLGKTIMVSHKGIWKDMNLPQNTKESILRAFKHGYQGIEFDIFKTKDDRFILAHDDSLNRVTNCKGKISKKNYDEIKDCLVIRNTLLPITKILLRKVKNPKKLSTLKEVLQALNGIEKEVVRMIWIDLKQKTPQLIAPLTRTILENTSVNNLSQVVINNTSTELLEGLKSSLPEVKYSREGKWGSEPLVDSSYIEDVGTTHDMISLNVGLRLGDEALWKVCGKKKRFKRRLSLLTQQAKTSQVPIIAWTVNNKKKIRELLTYELDFLLSDNVFPVP